jgi:hypothetical protein
MEVVLGFFSRQDEDLSVAYPHRSGGSVMFQKASPVKFNARYDEDCWIGWYSFVRYHVFVTVWFQSKRCEALLVVAIIGHAFSPMVRRMSWNPKSGD